MSLDSAKSEPSRDRGAVLRDAVGTDQGAGQTSLGQPEEPVFPLGAGTLGAISVNRRAVNGRKDKPLARRRYQRGHLFLKRIKGGPVWKGRFKEDVVVDGTVERVKRSVVLGDMKEYPTRRLALRALEERLRVVNSCFYTAQPVGTFAEVAKRWEDRVLGQLKDSTAANYRTHLHKHLVPFFGRYQVRDVRPELVQLFVSKLSGSPKTVRNVCITLRSLWRACRGWGYVTHDIMEGVVLAPPKRVRRFFFSPEQIKTIIAAAEEPYRTFYGLAAETGLRAGELCGLTTDDLDLQSSRLLVRQSVWRGKLCDPKTGDSVRVVELSPQACGQLTEFLRSRHSNKAGILFATRNATPWDANLVLKRKLKPLLGKLSIAIPKGNGFHAFRHANATMMDRLGTPLKLRQERLGHSDSRITQNIYTHVDSADASRVAGQLGEAVWGPISASNGLQKEKAGLEPETQTPHLH
jgi:integrase